MHESFKAYIRTYFFNLPALLDSGREDIEAFIEWSLTQNLELWFYDQLKDFPGWKEDQRVRFKNMYLVKFDHYARWKHEVSLVEQKMKDAGIQHAYLKGYAVQGYYDNPVVRFFNDIDFTAPFDCMENISHIFKNLKFTPLPCQSAFDKKRNFVKLLGHHTFAFEYHSYFYTTYHHEKNVSHILRDEMFKEELTFLSVVFHGKFFEISFRDLLDGFLVLKKNKSLNWEKIMHLAKSELLEQQVHRYLSHVMEWFDCNDLSLPKPPLHIKSQWVYRIQKKSLFRPKRRNMYYHMMEMICTLLTYDTFYMGICTFRNRYGLKL